MLLLTSLQIYKQQSVVYVILPGPCWSCCSDSIFQKHLSVYRLLSSATFDIKEILYQELKYLLFINNLVDPVDKFIKTWTK